MKAIARKMKDGSWNAEVEEIGYFEFGMVPVGKKVYPIVSPPDKEWLEKNNMNGKEVEGQIHRINGDYWNVKLKDNEAFGLILPPIHSDPADQNRKIIKTMLFPEPSTSETVQEDVKVKMISVILSNPENINVIAGCLETYAKAVLNHKP